MLPSSSRASTSRRTSASCRARSLQVLILVDEADLRGDGLQQPAVGRGIRLVRHPFAQQQHADQPIARADDRHDESHAQVLHPAAFTVRQRVCEVGWKVADRLRVVDQSQQRVLLRQLVRDQRGRRGVTLERLTAFLRAIEDVQ